MGCKDRPITQEPKEIQKIGFGLRENHKMKEHKICFQISVVDFLPTLRLLLLDGSESMLFSINHCISKVSHY